MPSLDNRGAGSCEEQACTFGKNNRTRPPGATVRTKLNERFSATTGAARTLPRRIIVLVLLGGGYWGFVNMGKLEDPAFTIKMAKILTPYPGATAREVQEELTYHLELIKR